MTAALQTAKTDSPALCDSIRFCLDKCQALQAHGNASSLSACRYTLLLELWEELKQEKPHKQHKTSGIARSHTTVERHHPNVAAPKRRRSWVAHPLAKIGESIVEDEEELIQSTSAKKTLGTRPTFLRLPTGSAEKEDKQGSREGTAERKQKITSPRQAYRPLDQLKRSFTRRKSPAQTLSPPTLSPVESSVPRKRAPKLAHLKGIGSSEFHADVEDSISPDVTPKHSVSSLPETEHHVSQVRGRQVREESSKVTVHAEVHEPEMGAVPQGRRVRISSPTSEEYPSVKTGLRNTSETSDQSEAFRVMPDTDELLPGQDLPFDKGEQALNSSVKQSVKFLHGDLRNSESQC